MVVWVMKPAELRDELLRKRAELVARRERARAHAQRAAGPLPGDFAEQAIERQNDDVVARIGESTESEIAAIDRTLRRLALGLYGVCAICGEPIDPRRLAARPHTDVCVNCSD